MPLSASLPASASSAGISATQGAHHVAHMFNTTPLPPKSASETGLPSPSVKLPATSATGGSSITSPSIPASFGAASGFGCKITCAQGLRATGTIARFAAVIAAKPRRVISAILEYPP